MTATRVIDDHSELENIGSLTHSELDAYVSSPGFVVVSGSNLNLPSSRQLVAGSNIIITDEGPGGNVIITAQITGSLASPIVWNETPIGLIDGNNRMFTLVRSPVDIMLFLNGVKQYAGNSSDFILTGSIIVFASDNVPRTQSNIEATYSY
jgi:hypothetical protein